jgi:hypothetical protein
MLLEAGYLVLRLSRDRFPIKVGAVLQSAPSRARALLRSFQRLGSPLIRPSNLQESALPTFSVEINGLVVAEV